MIRGTVINVNAGIFSSDEAYDVSRSGAYSEVREYRRISEQHSQTEL